MRSQLFLRFALCFALILSASCVDRPMETTPFAGSPPVAASSPGTTDAGAGCADDARTASFDLSFLDKLPSRGFRTPHDADDDASGSLRLFYMDAVDGSDSGDGLSPSTAWRTASKLNQTSFQAGDAILFKRGQTWDDSRIEFKSSGQEALPITLAAYGAGARPIINARAPVPGWSVEANWQAGSSNRWQLALENNPGRLWLSAQEYVQAVDAAHLDSARPWFYDTVNHQLLLLASSNPATAFSGMLEATGHDAAIALVGSDYATLRHLDVRGGSYTIAVYGSNHVTIEDCDVGRDSGSMGVFSCRKEWVPARPSSDYGIVRRCRIDSGDRLKHDYDRSRTEDGVHLRGSASHWKIYGNEVKDWGHTGIYFWQDIAGTVVSYNRAYSNWITTEDVSYGRGVSTGGREGGCQYNEFFDNRIEKTSAPNQIGGDHNAFYDNLIDTTFNSPLKPWGTAKAIDLTPGGLDPVFVCNYNRISNNIAYNCEEAGLRVEDWAGGYTIRFNTVESNMFVQCGLHPVETPDAGLVVWAPESAREPIARDNIYRKNLVYTAGVTNIISNRGKGMCIPNWNATSGTYGDVIEGNIQRNPGFIAPESGNFHLSGTTGVVEVGAQ